MKRISIPSETIIENLLKEIEVLTNRTCHIKKIYKSIYDNQLKERILKEHNLLKERFLKINNTAKLIRNHSPHEISLSCLLIEKCKRIDNEMIQNNKLFFV